MNQRSKNQKIETFALSLPSSLLKNIKTVAAYERVGVNDFILSLISIGLTTYETENFSDDEWRVLHTESDRRFEVKK